MSCKHGYKVPDIPINKIFVCQKSGKWDHEAFKCDAVCGMVTPQAQEFIFKGHDANITEVPWMVAVYRFQI